MKIIAKNQLSQILPLKDIGYNLSSNDEIDLLSLNIPLSTIQNSQNLMIQISTKNIIINDGERDLSPAEAVHHIFFNPNYGDIPKTNLGKIEVDPSLTPYNTVSTYTSFGDDFTDPYDIGGGQEFEIVHTKGENETTQTIYLDFNTLDNLSYLVEGSLFLENAIRDRVTFELVSNSIPYTIADGESEYKLVNDYLIVPNSNPLNGISINIPSLAGGDLLCNGGLVYAPLNSDGEKINGYWNATWDNENQIFKDISPAPNGDGSYNLYSVEVPFIKIVDSIYSHSILKPFTSQDIDQIAHGTRFKLTIKTRGDDHSWAISGELKLYRRYSI